MSGAPTGKRVALRAGVALVVFALIAAFIATRDPSDAYLWMKALHVMAVIAWMAGLFYLPRLFIYHHESEAGGEADRLFRVMEGRLYRIIMNPAMMLSWILGLWIAWSIHGFQGGWLHAKFAFVIAMTATHVWFGRLVKSFGRSERPLDGRKLRMVNEIPTLLMMVIVILAIVKPF